MSRPDSFPRVRSKAWARRPLSVFTNPTGCFVASFPDSIASVSGRTATVGATRLTRKRGPALPMFDFRLMLTCAKKPPKTERFSSSGLLHTTLSEAVYVFSLVSELWNSLFDARLTQGKNDENRQRERRVTRSRFSETRPSSTQSMPFNDRQQRASRPSAAAKPAVISQTRQSDLGGRLIPTLDHGHSQR